TQPESICLWGTAILARREMLEEVGLLDMRFFAYFEDSDLSARSSAGGWLNIMCMKAAVLHEGHRSTANRPPHFFYYMSRNEVLFWRKVLRSDGATQSMRAVRLSLSRALIAIGNLRDAELDRHVSACLCGVFDA